MTFEEANKWIASQNERIDALIAERDKYWQWWEEHGQTIDKLRDRIRKLEAAADDYNALAAELEITKKRIHTQEQVISINVREYTELEIKLDMANRVGQNLVEKTISQQGRIRDLEAQLTYAHVHALTQRKEALEAALRKIIAALADDTSSYTSVDNAILQAEASGLLTQSETDGKHED